MNGTLWQLGKKVLPSVRRAMFIDAVTRRPALRQEGHPQTALVKLGGLSVDDFPIALVFV